MPTAYSLTASINILHAFSLFLSIFILALSIQDCGILSLCLNPFFGVISIGYHITMLIQAFNNFKLESKSEDDWCAPVPTVAYTIAAYLLSLGWLGAYIAMAVVLSSREQEVHVFDARVAIPQTLRTTQKVQIMLDPLACVIIGNIAVKSTIERLRLCKSREILF